MLESTAAYKDVPLPYVGGVLGARCIPVIADPTHFLYPKIHAFLTKRPEWAIHGLPRRFCNTILLSPPEDDGAYHKEVDWYLEYLIDSLRTPADMEIFRTNNIFERLLSHYESKSCAIQAKEKIVRLLLRSVAVGAATTLITRYGIMAWVRTMLDQGDRRGRSLKVLVERLWQECDREKVQQWSNGSMKGLVDEVAKVKV